jgi:small-conductance mechanosensitive channel
MEQFLRDNTESILIQILIIIFVTLILQLIIHKSLELVVRKIVRESKHGNKLEKRKREDTLLRVFRTLSIVILWIIAVFVILSRLHINIAAIATGAGLIGVVAGLGAQSLIKDYLAGILIIIENEYRVGDIVTLSDGSNRVTGQVEDISIRATRLRDLDGNLHIVPNGLAGVITNLSFEYAKINLDLGVSYGSDIDKVENIVNQVGEEMFKDKKWKDQIIEPIRFARLDNFDDSALTIKIFGTVQPASQWEVAGEFRRRLKIAFEKNGVEIPFPQVVVHKK